MKGKAIAGFVLSIIGVVFGFFGGILAIIGLPVSIIGLVLAVIGRKGLIAAGEPSGIGTAGLVIGIIAVVGSAITFFTCGICILCVGTAASLA